MAMKVGIVGLPNAGKTTLFNALARMQAETASYPFTTVDPNVAVVEVPDERLEAVMKATGASGLVPDSLELIDIAGLIEGAHKGEGLGNQFLHHIRECDAIVQVVRCFDEGQVAHPAGRVDPASDMEMLETELVYADLERAQRWLEKASREAKSGEKARHSEAEWLKSVYEVLSSGGRAATVPTPEGLEELERELGLLTAKPMLYLANVSEDEASSAVEQAAPEVAAQAAKSAAGALLTSAKIEAELAELEPQEAQSMHEELGLGESNLKRLIKAANGLLQTITFFTGQPGSEARAWSVEQGTTAAQAAGKVHTDMERGFVRADVVPWDVLADAGSMAAAREAGKVHSEGRDYVVQDGDVLTVKFTA